MALAPSHTPALLYSQDFNSFLVNERIYMKRPFRGQDFHMFGTVQQLVKLRNCHMLTMMVDEVLDDHGQQLDRWEVQRLLGFPGRTTFPFSFETKKVKGTETWVYDPAKVTAPASPTGRRRRNPIPPPQPRVHANPPPPVIPPEPDKTLLDKEKELDELFAKRRAAAQAASAQSRLLTAAREQVLEALRVLGVTTDLTYDEFKRLRRQVLTKWHADLETQHVLSHGEGAREEFRVKAKQVSDALAVVDNALRQRDSRLPTYQEN